MERVREEQRTKEASDKAFATESTPDAMARKLIITQTMTDSAGAYSVAQSIARWASIEAMRNTCSILWEKGYTVLAEDLIGNAATEREVEDLADLLILLGSRDTTRMASQLVDRALAQFAWFRPATDFAEFARIVKERGWTVWDLQVREECAIRRDPDMLAQLIKTMGTEDAAETIKMAADSRPTADIPALLAMMEKLSMNDQAEVLMDALQNVRPDDVAVVKEAWEMAKEYSD
jgi:hypothetical protein